VGIRRASEGCQVRLGQDLFCDLYRPCQRGNDENTNGLIRQYFPKGTDFRKVTNAELRSVVNKQTIDQEIGWNTEPPPQVFLGEHSGALETAGTVIIS